MTEDDDYVAPKTPLDFVSRDQLQDMWGSGFTIIQRQTFGHDIYELADRVRRPGMARQWVDKADVKKFLGNGWRQVNSEEYPGLFDPYGYEGPIVVHQLALFECPQHKVDAAHAAQIAAAHKVVDDWKEEWGAQFAGTITVDGQTETIGDPFLDGLLKKRH